MRIGIRLLGLAVVLSSMTVAACVAALQLSSIEERVVSVSTTSFDFMTVNQNTTASTGSGFFMLKPQSMADDDIVNRIVRGSCSNDFQLQLPPPVGSDGDAFLNPIELKYMCGGAAAIPGLTCTPIIYSFGATFTPTAPGSQTCVVQIGWMGGNGSGGAMITLTGSGAAPMNAMTVTPSNTSQASPYEFGTVPLGTDSAPVDIIASNVGTASLTVTVTNTDMVAFTGIPATTTFTLAPPPSASNSRTLLVRCHPAAATTYTATVTVSAAEDAALTKKVFLRCTGVATTITVTPPSFDFQQVFVGQLPVASSSVTINSSGSGSAAVSLSQFKLTNTPPGLAFLGGAPNTVMTPASITLTYDPAMERPSGSLGTLDFVAGTQPLSIPISGGAVIGSLSTNPAIGDFGPICANATPSPIDLELYANASGDIEIGSENLMSGPFTATRQPAGALPQTVRGHHMGSLTYTASVHPVTPGDVTGSLVLTARMPDATSHMLPTQYSIPLKAHVLAAGVSPTPDAVHLAGAPVTKPSAFKQVKLTNCGTGPLVVTGSHVDGLNGTDPHDFMATPLDVSLPKTLGMTESLTFVVQMIPSREGPRTANLVIEHGAGNTTVPLDGNGDPSGTDAGGRDRETYYACSTGRPFGFALIGLVLVFALRRRRR